MHVRHGRQRDVWARCLCLAGRHPTMYQNPQSSRELLSLFHSSVPSCGPAPFASFSTTTKTNSLHQWANNSVYRNAAALLPFPLRRWGVDPSQLFQLCPSPSNNQKCNSQRKSPCFFTFDLSLSTATCQKINKRQHVSAWKSKQECFRAFRNARRGL